MSWTATLFGNWFVWGGGILFGTGNGVLGGILGVIGITLVWLGWGLATEE